MVTFTLEPSAIAAINAVIGKNNNSNFTTVFADAPLNPKEHMSFALSLNGLRSDLAFSFQYTAADLFEPKMLNSDWHRPYNFPDVSKPLTRAEQKAAVLDILETLNKPELIHCVLTMFDKTKYTQGSNPNCCDTCLFQLTCLQER